MNSHKNVDNQNMLISKSNSHKHDHVLENVKTGAVLVLNTETNKITEFPGFKSFPMRFNEAKEFCETHSEHRILTNKDLDLFKHTIKTDIIPVSHRQYRASVDKNKLLIKKEDRTKTTKSTADITREILKLEDDMQRELFDDYYRRLNIYLEEKKRNSNHSSPTHSSADDQKCDILLNGPKLFPDWEEDSNDMDVEEDISADTAVVMKTVN